MIDSDGERCNAGRAGNGSQWQGRTRMGGGKAQRKCVHYMQGWCCGFVFDDVDNFNDSAPSTEVL